ncbi:hypothetical protein UFOVP238_10 [uncultured Caudovirales phage]|uniref:Uncharacterized protein n=1 Tax=uncultured Caudovirales phage TaxID=2100421 RepID=A0A6J7WUA3_9CAUD|nr:hypothetical protein UFOVP238_10 [uncultured Caudovirales phage]
MNRSSERKKDFLDQLAKHRSIGSVDPVFVYTSNGATPKDSVTEKLFHLLYGYTDDNGAFHQGCLRGRMTISEIREVIEQISLITRKQ